MERNTKGKNRFEKFLPIVAGLVVFLVFGNVALGGWNTVPINPVHQGDPVVMGQYWYLWDFPPGRTISASPSSGFLEKEIWQKLKFTDLVRYNSWYNPYPRMPPPPINMEEKRMIQKILEVRRTIPASPSSGAVTRRIFPQTVPPGGTLTITLIPSPTCIFNSPDYSVSEVRVSEDIPAGFTYLNTTEYNATILGNVVSLRQIGVSSIIYTLKASSIAGTYTIKGTFLDKRWGVGTVGGTTSIRVGSGYDANGISKPFLAVMDNFIGLIGKQKSFCKVWDWKKFLQLN